MDEILALKLELEAVRRAYWQSQQTLSQLLIERSIEVERELRKQLEAQNSQQNGGDATGETAVPDGARQAA